MMMEVNLLPLELRRVEHTPLPRLLIVIVGTALIMTTAAFGVVVNWRKVPDLQGREATLIADMRSSEAQASVYDRLLDDIAETQDRKKAIAELWRTRIPWSKKLAEVAKMTPAFIGLTGIELEEARLRSRAGQDETGGMFTIESICAGADLDRLAYFRRIVQGDVAVKDGDDPWVGKRFFSSFIDLLPTSTQKVEMEDYVEQEALKFSLKMPIKSASSRLSEAVQVIQDEENRKRTEERQRAAGERMNSRKTTTARGSNANEAKTAPVAMPEAPEKRQIPAEQATETGAEGDENAQEIEMPATETREEKDENAPETEPPAIEKRDESVQKAPEMLESALEPAAPEATDVLNDEDDAK